jgi:hypothetical protein
MAETSIQALNSDDKRFLLVLTILARRAKALTEDMQSRLKRTPDVQDYRSAFEQELKHANPKLKPYPRTETRA